MLPDTNVTLLIVIFSCVEVNQMEKLPMVNKKMEEAMAEALLGERGQSRYTPTIEA